MGMKPIHRNGTVGVAAVTVSFGQTVRKLEINNTHASNNLLITLDGTNYFTVKAGFTLDLEMKVVTITVKGSGAGTTYEIIGVN